MKWDVRHLKILKQVIIHDLIYILKGTLWLLCGKYINGGEDISKSRRLVNRFLPLFTQEILVAWTEVLVIKRGELTRF